MVAGHIKGHRGCELNLQQTSRGTDTHRREQWLGTRRCRLLWQEGLSVRGTGELKCVSSNKRALLLGHQQRRQPPPPAQRACMVLGAFDCC